MRKLVLEKRERKTFDTFMTYLMDQDGRCSADGGDHTFYCLKLNDENFSFDGYDKFKEQVEKEGLYDWSWVAGLIPNKNLEDGKVPVSWLPIFGDPNRYVTKWLRNGTPSGAVEEVFRDRRMKIKDRIDYFAIPAEEQLSLNALKEELEKIGLPCRIRSHHRKGDFLETNLEFSQEACKKWNDIPVSGGYKIVWLIRNKFVINKHKFNSVEKVVDYFKENKDLYEIAEAEETIKKAGKKLIKESIDKESIEDMIDRLNWRRIGSWKFHLDSSSDDYFSIVAEDQTGEKDGVEWVWYYVDGEVNVYYWFDNIQDREVRGIDSIRKLFDLISTDRNLEDLNESAKVNESKEYTFEKMKKITEILYDNIEELNYDDAQDIADYVSEKMESEDVDREYVAETLEQMLDDCGIRISFDLSTRLASKIIAL